MSQIGIDGILRSAWKTFHLDAIRGVVRQTIVDLEGCGLATSPGRSIQVQSERATDADWSASFAYALQAYRSAACTGLDASFAALPLPPGRPAPAVETP